VQILYSKIINGQLQAGESLAATLGYDDFPRSAGWALVVQILGPTGPAGSVACGAASDADSFSFSLPASATTTWPGGKYAYSVQATLASPATVSIAERGVFQVLPNPTNTTAAMTILAAINAVILGAAGDDQLTVSVDGVQLKYWMRDRGIDDVLKLQQRFEAIVEKEIRQLGGGGGRYSIKHHAGEDYRLGAPWFGWPSGRVN
jgi:hypothetical protein